MTTSTMNLFVTKLPRDVTDADLMRACETCKPVSATVMLDAATGKSKGFGFVLFATAEDGELALQKLNGTAVAGKSRTFHLVMQPSKHDGRISCVESHALYIRNIPMAATRDEIHSFLGQYGTLAYSVMRPDNYGSPVWVVYAEYDCVECAKSSLKMFHGSSAFFANGLPILAKYADSSEIKEYRRHRRLECGSEAAATAAVLVPAASSRTTSPVKEMIPGLPNVYRHNPYAAVVMGASSSSSTMAIHERKISVSWIPVC